MASLKGNKTCSSSIPDRSLNLWDDDFVQSMETPYEGSEYRERVETLVNEVKMLLKEMQTQDCSLIKGLEMVEMVDALQCLGIDRYFKAEIKEALDYVYRCWDESVGLGLQCESITRNLNATALGLRLLRLHHYDV
ncbi:gamma-humulene synthase [Cryptomeria japonica]|uniref:gamma-humulene synthase n=1 Tax=Cryptomeria japonica TaxID=3369 RepID=UPI0027DAA3C9|nr:gamma-humulene synthase [Cryptomeria japonica]XP_057860235.2 gamma-humulene synthase [Cryptomeria japonica]